MMTHTLVLAGSIKKVTVVWAVITATLFAQEVIHPVTTPCSPWSNPATVTLLGGMIVTIIGATATAAVLVINALRPTLAAIAKDTEAVKGHVNSEKTADTKTIEYQARENQILRDQIADRDHIRDLLAQSTATGVSPKEKEKP